MLIFILATISVVTISISYIWGSSTWVLSYTRMIAFMVTAALAGEIVFGAASIIWDYLIANSFCPWIMIFRGRPSSVIIAEVANHAHNLFSPVNTGNVLSSVSGIGSAMAELIGGPALGIFLTAVFVFLSFKCFAVLFNKLFNRK